MSRMIQFPQFQLAQLTPEVLIRVASTASKYQMEGNVYFWSTETNTIKILLSISNVVFRDKKLHFSLSFNEIKKIWSTLKYNPYPTISFSPEQKRTPSIFCKPNDFVTSYQIKFTELLSKTY